MDIWWARIISPFVQALSLNHLKNTPLRLPLLSLFLFFLAMLADLSLPVLAGVDVVAYWTLPGGATPVLGSHNLMSIFQGYRFFFSSIENLRTFEVRVRESSCRCSLAVRC